MLKLKVQLEQTIQPLIYEALMAPLNSFAEKHRRETDRNDLTTVAFCRALAAQAAKYFAKHRGLARWRGIIAQDSAMQIVIDVNRHPQRGYFSHAYITTIQTELVTRLAKNATYK
jgi:hypothetical protein